MVIRIHGKDESRVQFTVSAPLFNTILVFFSDFIYQEEKKAEKSDSPNIDEIVSPGMNTWLME